MRLSLKVILPCLMSAFAASAWSVIAAGDWATAEVLATAVGVLGAIGSAVAAISRWLSAKGGVTEPQQAPPGAEAAEAAAPHRWSWAIQGGTAVIVGAMLGTGTAVMFRGTVHPYGTPGSGGGNTSLSPDPSSSHNNSPSSGPSATQSARSPTPSATSQPPREVSGSITSPANGTTTGKNSMPVVSTLKGPVATGYVYVLVQIGGDHYFFYPASTSDSSTYVSNVLLGKAEITVRITFTLHLAFLTKAADAAVRAEWDRPGTEYNTKGMTAPGGTAFLNTITLNRNPPASSPPSTP